MKKILIFSLMAFGMFATPVLAQNRTQKAKTTVAGKARKFWDNAKKSMHCAENTCPSTPTTSIKEAMPTN